MPSWRSRCPKLAKRQHVQPALEGHPNTLVGSQSDAMAVSSAGWILGSCYILLLGGLGATFKYTRLPHVDLNRAPKNNSAKSTMSPVRSGKVNATFKCTVMTWVDMNSVCKVPNLVPSLVPTFKAYQTTGDTSATKVRASPCGWNLWLVPPRDITGWLERSRLEEWATSRVAWVKEFLSEKNLANQN